MRYRAFFSYARADDRIARWLHGQLDGYRTPKPLVNTSGALGPVPGTLHPIFRDRTDLQAGGQIDQSLQQALEASDALIVLCTPTSARSHWVNHECDTFLKLGRADRIFPVIAAGHPDSGDPKTECFPPALRGKGLLAADLRNKVGDGREVGRLKLISGLLGVSLDRLVQREMRRKRARQLGVTTGFFLAGFALASAAWLTMQVQDERARSLSQFFAERGAAALADGDYVSAAKLAATGADLLLREGKDVRSELHDVLVAALHDGNRVSAVLTSGDGFLYSRNSRYVLAIDRRRNDDGSTSPSVAVLYDVREARPIGTFNVDSPVTAMDVSSDGQSMALAHRGAVDIRRIEDFAVSRSITQRDPYIPSVIFDGDSLLVLSQDPPGEGDGSTTLVSWNWRSGDQQTAYSGDLDYTWASFSRDRAYVIASSYLGASVWDRESGMLLDSPEADRDTSISRAVGADRTLLLVESGNTSTYRLRVRDVRTRRTIGVIDSVSKSAGLFLTRDGTQLLIITPDGNVDLWSVHPVRKLWAATIPDRDLRLVTLVEDGQQAIRTVNGRGEVARWPFQATGLGAPEQEPEQPVPAAPRESESLSSTEGATLRVLDPRRSRPLATFTVPGNVHSAELSNDESVLAVGGENGVATYSLKDGSNLELLSSEPTSKVSVSGDGRLVAGLFQRGGVAVWSRDQRSKILEVTDRKLAATGVALRSDGLALATAGLGESIYTWSTSRGLHTRDLSGLWFGVVDVRFATLSETLVAAGGDYRICVWRSVFGHWWPSQCAPKLERGHMYTVAEPAMSYLHVDATKDGQKVLGVRGDGSAQIWSMDGPRIISNFLGHNGNVNSGRLSPRGDFAVTAGDDGSVRVWSATSGRQIALVESNAEPMQFAAFTSNGERIVTVSKSGRVSVWALPYLSATGVQSLIQACNLILGARGDRYSQTELQRDAVLNAFVTSPDFRACRKHLH